MGPRNGDSRFNMEADTVKRMLNFYLNDWLKRFSKVTEAELEMPDIPSLGVDEGVLRLKKDEVLEWAYCRNLILHTGKAEKTHPSLVL